MTVAPPRRTGSLARFARDRRGVAAVEFALILPVMVALYLGGVELSQGIAIDRKTTLVARAIGDLVAQSPNQCVKNTDMTAILDASSAIIAPYNSAKLSVVVSHITVTAGTAKVTWSDTKNGTARAVGSTIALPTALNVDNTSVVLAESSYDYQPIVGYVITGSMTLSDRIYMRPRSLASLQREPSCN